MNNTQQQNLSPSDAHEELLRIRHHSLFAPRDFDISPYFGRRQAVPCAWLRLPEAALGGG
jgi:hypothetical protein